MAGQLQVPGHANHSFDSGDGIDDAALALLQGGRTFDEDVSETFEGSAPHPGLGNTGGVDVSILRTDEADGVTWYIIQMTEQYEQRLYRKRYGDFKTLNAALKHSVSGTKDRKSMTGLGIRNGIKSRAASVGNLVTSGSFAGDDKADGKLKIPELPSSGSIGLRHKLNLGDFNKNRQDGLTKYLRELFAQNFSQKEQNILERFFSEDSAIAIEKKPPVITGGPMTPGGFIAALETAPSTDAAPADVHCPAPEAAPGANDALAWLISGESTLAVAEGDHMHATASAPLSSFSTAPGGSFNRTRGNTDSAMDRPQQSPRRTPWDVAPPPPQSWSPPAMTSHPRTSWSKPPPDAKDDQISRRTTYPDLSAASEGVHAPPLSSSASEPSPAAAQASRLGMTRAASADKIDDYNRNRIESSDSADAVLEALLKPHQPQLAPASFVPPVPEEGLASFWGMGCAAPSSKPYPEGRSSSRARSESPKGSREYLTGEGSIAEELVPPGSSLSEDVRSRLKFLNAKDQKTTAHRECLNSSKREAALLLQLKRTMAAYSEALEHGKICEGLPDDQGAELSQEVVVKYTQRIQLLRGAMALLEEDEVISLPAPSVKQHLQGLVFASYARSADVVNHNHVPKKDRSQDGSTVETSSGAPSGGMSGMFASLSASLTLPRSGSGGEDFPTADSSIISQGVITGS